MRVIIPLPMSTISVLAALGNGVGSMHTVGQLCLGKQGHVS